MSFLERIFSPAPEINTIDSDAFEKMIKEKDTVVLDVRTPHENQNGCIPNSVLIDIHDYDFAARLDELDRSKTYLVYCRAGRRSYNACIKMKEMGFEKVYNLAHGFNRWKGEIA